MKPLRHTWAVAAMTLLLWASAFAGQVNCPGAASTQPPTETNETTTTNSVTTTIILAIVNLIA